jgi:hypothetical protein
LVTRRRTGSRLVTGRRGNPTADRLVEAAKTAHTELGEVVLDLAQLQRRLAVVRSQLGYAVTMYDSGAVIELPDEDEER